MIGENRLTAADLDVVGALSPTRTLPMTKLFRQLCDRAQSHILEAKGLRKLYADTHRREVEYALVPDRPGAPELEPQEAVVGWPPTRDVVGNPTDRYEFDYIMDQRRSGGGIQYLDKWRGYPEDQATWEPASHLNGCPALLRAWRRRHRNRRPSLSAAIFSFGHPPPSLFARCRPLTAVWRGGTGCRSTPRGGSSLSTQPMA
ncbi:hypothetical protein EAH_00067120 [Eimeria acervulina]|uniref:Chromo domain-containing protein n=1 Tax=Eimeria acervulina TaxID=5801 RepID=U6GQV6_EIMAC|nr:hypothetical protein EAH_00067120 [Eimeria acervulina]CDI82611.1 hypothetical protein EAH_00067120 [Eimeria acervulina]